MTHLTPEVCICAAVWTKDCQLIRGHRHSDCITAIVARGLEVERSPRSQGFITSRGLFVDREDGLKLMRKSGRSRLKGSWDDCTVLTSEDLY